ncbi:sulfatase-like hydrolase/transferase [Ferruginibacter paludis]|uniref:LTA synthase family protein n=1 Tax=Ferruginibacter paludis TaxID=1310417 RepID=UPI0025B2D9D7|nr:alkaline phosphatase family protein [Ferruginibacter paludis]MDN3657649.1 sulfatase-like hydrolase/transferase [Ferruginibacter paludis]
MKKWSSLFTQRFGPLFLLTLIICGISFITRLILLIKSWPNLEFSPLLLLGIFVIGLFYDLVVSSFFAIPVALYCWLINDSFFQKKGQRVPLFIFFFILIFIIVTIAGSEIVFWNEFNVRFNFIAVDYLVYTNEVLGNIQESYNMPLIISAVVLVTLLILFLVKKALIASQLKSMRFGKRTVWFLLFLLVPLAGYFLVNSRWKNISKNNYVNELGGNGTYEFGAAFWNNELDYNRFYQVNNDTANIKILRNQLQTSNATFTNDPLSVERLIHNDSAEKKWNVVLISVESLSGDYLQYFGSKENITPYLDSLIPQSLFFKNFYASGTRTVRGLEALSLGITPTPGQSIVRRPNNENLFTIGGVLKGKGYDVNFIYGGNSFFDNMGYFFSHNGYTVLDKRDIPDSLVHHTTAWGIDDEAAFNFCLQQCDKSYNKRTLFFNHLMTISNHRPYTYPEGKIDIPSSSQSMQGGVKYTDYAIHKFLKDAEKKPWFNNTIFVIVADHCSRSAGKTDLPANRYHIPCFIYAPALVKPKIEERLASQIDLAPTLLGIMNMNYSSRFLGFDLYRTPVERDRVFISTYQNMGFIKDNKLLILSPQKKIAQFQTDFSTGILAPIPLSDELSKEAIAWYQGASFLFKTHRYTIKN